MRVPQRGWRQAHLYSHPQRRCHRCSLVSLGLTLWLFFFGYFVGTYHSDSFQRVHSQLFFDDELFERATIFADVSGSLHRSGSSSTLPSSIPAFPLCNGERRKSAVGVFRPAGSLLLPPLSDSQIEAFEATRETVRSALPAAVNAQAKRFPWCESDAAYKHFNSSPPRLTGWETSSSRCLSQLWADFDPAHTAVMHCAHFNSYCEFYAALPSFDGPSVDPLPPSRMTTKAMLSNFDMNYIAPRFWPNLTVCAERTKATIPPGNDLGDVVLSGDIRKLMTRSRGENIDPPEVGIIYGAYVTRYGTIISPSICIPGWPDEPRESWPAFVDSYFSNNQTKDWLDVKEVMVITHNHQGMGWHFLTAEAYRVMIALPYLQAHPDIFIHISGDEAWTEHYEQLFDIPRQRFIYDESIRADIVYVVESVERFDIPSLGMTQIIQRHLHEMAGMPLDRRRSLLGEPRPKTTVTLPIHVQQASQGQGEDETAIRIVVMARGDLWRGGAVVNAAELLQALQDFGLVYPSKIGDSSLRIEVDELMGSFLAFQSRKLFAQADIIISSMGDGMGHIYSARPGTQWINLMISNTHIAIGAAARLGVGIHLFAAIEMTQIGLEEGASGSNLIVDVPALLRVVESILDERFRPTVR